MNKLKLGLVGMNHVNVEVGGAKPKYKDTNSKYLFVKYYFKYTTQYNSSYHENWDYYGEYVVCALVNVTKDFNPYSENLILVPSDTSSYQIRPKLIYKDKKGYYYKPHGKVVRLTELEKKEVDDFINKNKNDN